MVFFTVKLFNKDFISRLKIKDFVIESLYSDGFIYEDVAVALQTHEVFDVVTHSIPKQKYQERYSHVTSELLKELDDENVIGFLNINGTNEQGQPVNIPNSMFLKGKGKILYESRELYYTSFEKNIQLRIDILRNWFLVLLALATLVFGFIQFKNGSQEKQTNSDLQQKIKLIQVQLDSIKMKSYYSDIDLSLQQKEINDTSNFIKDLDTIPNSKSD